MDPSDSRLPPLFVLAGLTGAGPHTAAAPVPEIATLQLRALNHRFIHTGLDAAGALMQALTGHDFLHTAHDGSWNDRDAFLAMVREQPRRDGAACVGMQARFYGPVALVQGLLSDPGAGTRIRYTDVHVWSGSTWRLVSVQDTPVHDAAAVPMRLGVPVRHAAWTGRDPQGDDHDVLHALNAAYVQAFRDADVVWYDAHLAPDYTVVSGDGAMEDRAAALADFAVPYYADFFAAFPLDRVVVRRFADIALIHAENAYERKDGRRGVNRYTDVWHRHGRRWCCVAAHITVHKAAALPA